MQYEGKKQHYYIVNGITWYRLIAAPVIALCVFMEEESIFKWLLAASFFTDAIDGFLARKLKVATPSGARIDSIADDATLVAAIYGAAIFRSAFFSDHRFAIFLMIGLFLLQYALALYRYGKLSSFHTYLAKLAMFLQGSFLILLFFLPSTPVWLFYVATVVTVLEFVEEIILVMILSRWETNVKGIYWVLLKRKRTLGSQNPQV